MCFDFLSILLAGLLAGQLLFDALDLAFCRVGADGLQLILSGDHLAVLGPGALQVDGVKLTLGGADAAADALVGVDHTAAAAEAAGSLGLDLLLGEGDRSEEAHV